MATLNSLAHEVIRLLSSGTPSKDSNLNKDYIIAELRQAIHFRIKGDYFQQKNDGSSDVSYHYIATYPDLPVLFDEDKNRCYIDMPSYAILLPGGLGIQEVRPQTGDIEKDVAMIPIMPHEFELFRSLSVGLEVMIDQFCWEPDRSKIWFTEANNETLLEAGIETVGMKSVVIDPADVGDDDVLPIPPELELTVMQDVLQLHGYNAVKPADITNNGNPNN